jgi:hypothetical protein
MMDFKQVIPLIIEGFKKEKVRYALIGGFAMAALGLSRNTEDVDFLIDKEDLPKVDSVLKNLNYQCVFNNENVSQYVSGLKIFGEVDVLHAFRDISKSMLSRAKEADILAGKARVMVLEAEDIIGLKIQSMVNNPDRETRETADIEDLINRFHKKIDWDLVEKYFLLFDRRDLFLKLKGKYGSV